MILWNHILYMEPEAIAANDRHWGMKSGPRPGAEIEYLNVEGAWVSLGTAADMAEAWRLVVGLVLFQYFRK
jgi:hypothetical protein